MTFDHPDVDDDDDDDGNKHFTHFIFGYCHVIVEKKRKIYSRRTVVSFECIFIL